MAVTQEPVAPKKLAQSIFDDLRQRILRDEWAPGDRLPPERELAAAYGANRNTLREAIGKLVHEGLVSVRRGSGATVLDFRTTGGLGLVGPFLEHGARVDERASALLDLLEARVRVLQLTVDLAARRATHADHERLEAIAAAQQDALRRGDRESLARGDLRWMDALIDAAHSLPVRWIANTFIEIYQGFLDRFPSLWVVDAGYSDWLAALMNALTTRDGAAAADLVREHFMRTDAILDELLRGIAPAVGTSRTAEA